MALYEQGSGPWGLLNLFRDDWLITRQATKLFFVCTIFVLALTPVFLGKIDPSHMPFWARLSLSFFGVVGTIALFFVWIGMLKYWIRIDQSGKWSRRLSLAVLTLGLWWGACLYCWAVYLPQVLRKEPQRA